MALPLGETAVADNLSGVHGEDYLKCAVHPGLTIDMHLDAVDGIAHDVVEGVKSLPRRGAEIGGLLLGTVARDAAAQIVVERYQRLDCEHRFGPQFALDDAELDEIEAIAASRVHDEELGVVGYYRSNTRPDFLLEASDAQILDRYFPDPGDLTLLIQPVNSREIRARFLVRNESRIWEAAGDEFDFRGRVVGPLRTAPPDTEPEPEPVTAPSPVADRPSRLVPDFMPAGALSRPAPRINIEMLPPAYSETREQQEETKPRSRRWWPLAGALTLIGGTLLFLLSGHRGDTPGTAVSATAAAENAGPVRPLGLYADPAGDTWRISWNASASALQQARDVALFVREGDDQNRIDLAAQDLQSGTYQYQPKPAKQAARDVTFRLEVTDAAGHVSAESFRVMRTVAQAAAVAPPIAKPAPVTPNPKALKRVPPVVPASIRPRIRGSIPIDVRVSIDRRGDVTSAVLVTRAHNGLTSFLAGRAVAAAKQWRFEPGPAVEVIHFVFEH